MGSFIVPTKSMGVDAKSHEPAFAPDEIAAMRDPLRLYVIHSKSHDHGFLSDKS